MDLDFDKYIPSRMLLTAVGSLGNLSPQATREVQRSEFIVTGYRIGAWFNATAGGVAAGSPLPYVQLSGGVPNASAWLVNAQLQLSDVVVFDSFTPLPLWGGYGDQDEILTEPWRLPVKRNVTFLVNNATGVNGITVALLLKGYKRLREG